MTYIAKSPLEMVTLSENKDVPIEGTRGLYAKEDGWYDVDSTGATKKIADKADIDAAVEETKSELAKKMDSAYTKAEHDPDAGEMVSKEAELTAQEIYDDALLEFTHSDTGVPIAGFKIDEVSVYGGRGTGERKVYMQYLDGGVAAEALGERAILIPEEAPGYSGAVRKAKLKRIMDASVEGDEGDVPVYSPEMSVYSAEAVDEKLDAKLDSTVTINGQTRTVTTEEMVETIAVFAEYVDGKADKCQTGGGFAGGEGASIGGDSRGNEGCGAAVGKGAMAGDGFAGGCGAQTGCKKSDPATGYSWIDYAIDAIQLGTGFNTNEKTLQVYDYTMMNADGSIPMERIPSLLGHGIKSISWTAGETALLERGCAYFIKSNSSSNTLSVYDGNGSKRSDAGGDTLPSGKWMFVILSDNIRDTQNKTGYNDMLIAPTTLSITDKTFVCFEENPDVCVKCDASFYGWKMKM